MPLGYIDAQSFHGDVYENAAVLLCKRFLPPVSLNLLEQSNNSIKFSLHWVDEQVSFIVVRIVPAQRRVTRLKVLTIFNDYRGLASTLRKF